MTSREQAVQAEATDTRNWLDDFAAAPEDVRAMLGLSSHREGTLAMVRSRIPFSHFNMVLTLGCPAPVNDEAFATIDHFYAAGDSAQHWVLVNDFSEPADLGERLRARGYTEADAWDRVILRGARPDLWAAHADGCEAVGPQNIADWSDFICRCYGMPPPIGAWLHRLVGRSGWLHAIRRQGGAASGPVVMARSLYVAVDGWAWLGIDAPIPGVMAPCFDDDRRVIAHLLQRAAEAGARHFVSDVEQVNDAGSGPAYDGWRALGFERAYRRRVFRKG